MIKTLEEIQQQIYRVQIIRQPEKIKGILREYAESIIDECALVCMTDDVIQEDIKRVKEQIV